MTSSPGDAKAPLPEDRTLSARDVELYLRRHPDFLLHHPQVIDQLAVPGKTEGKGLADLQQHLIDKLRRDLAQVTKERDLVISRSHHNKLSQDRAHRAVVRLLAANSFEQFIDTISGELPEILGLDCIALGVEQPSDSESAGPVEGICSLFPGTVDGLIGIGQPVALRDQIEGEVTLYGTFAPLIRSDALVRLTISDDTPPALLAFGSQSPDQFEPGQGTELVRFLGQVVENAIRTWLKLPG